MTILDLLTADLDTMRGFALVFDAALAEILAERWYAYGTPNCCPLPRTLADGRFMLCADILSEVRPGGLLEEMWNAADHAVLLSSVEVIPMADAVALLPVETFPGV